MDFKRQFPPSNFFSRFDLEAFLKSPTAVQISLSGFNNLDHARNFARKYGGTHSGYSTRMTHGGRGSSATVTVVKTNDWIELANQAYDKAVTEKTQILRRFQMQDPAALMTNIPTKRPASPDIVILD